MGQIADDMIDGTSCSWCGVYFEGTHGYPVLCNDCFKGAVKKYGSAKAVLEKFALQKTLEKET